MSFFRTVPRTTTVGLFVVISLVAQLQTLVDLHPAR
jgi:hypothetical protein